MQTRAKGAGSWFRRWHLLFGVLAVVLILPAAPGVAATPRGGLSVGSVPPRESLGAALAPERGVLAPAAAQGLTPVRVAMQYIISDAGLLVADDFGYFREAGIDFQTQRVDNIELQAAMASGQIDVGGIGITAAVLNAYMRGVRLKVVADRATFIPGHGYTAIVVRKDLVDSGQVRSLRDLRGRRIAPQPPFRGTPSWFLTTRLLESEGVGENELDWVPLGFADQNAGLAGRTVDAAVQAEPGVTGAVESGLGVRLRGLDEVINPFSLGGMAYSETFATQLDPARRFMVAYLRGVRTYLDAITRNERRAEVVATLARHTAVKDPAVYERMVMPWINPDGSFSLNGYGEVQEYFIRHGTQQQMVDMTQIVDLSFAQYAAQQLGPYR